jgi:glutathione S-transferase
MYPRTEPDRHRALKISALATGLADKAVGLFYELHLHAPVSEAWVQRCRTQIEAVLDALEQERAGRTSPYWFGERIGHADVAVAVVLRHLNEAHPGMVSMDAYPALESHGAKLEALEVFQEISQPFIAPA